MTQELREEARRREREQEETAKRREQFTRDIRFVASFPEGRRFLRWLIERGGIFAEDYQPGPLGAFRAGLRTASIRLWEILRTALPKNEFVRIVLDEEHGEGTSSGSMTSTA